MNCFHFDSELKGKHFRFTDQVEFKIPKKYDNDFRRGEEAECSEDTDDNKSAITTSSQQNTPSQGKTNRSSPVKKLHKMYRKQLENTPGGKNLPSKESGESKLSMGSQGNKETSSLVPASPNLYFFQQMNHKLEDKNRLQSRPLLLWLLLNGTASS